MVGVVLILIGLASLRRALSVRVHYHEHDHGGERHAHFHIHKKVHEQSDRQRHQHTHVPLGVGLLHGVAGGSHLVAVLPAIALPSLASGFAYVAGYGIGTIVAMIAFAWTIGRVTRLWMQRRAAAYNVVLSCLSLVAVAVGVLWLVHAV